MHDMEERQEQIEGLLWDMDEFFADSRLLEDAWAQFEESGDLPDKLYKKLKRMLHKAISKGYAA